MKNNARYVKIVEWSEEDRSYVRSTLLERLELIEDIETGESQIDAGKGMPHGKALKAVVSRIDR